MFLPIPTSFLGQKRILLKGFLLCGTFITINSEFSKKGEILMLGFHTDGIRFFGASDSLLEKAKKHKLPIVKKSTTNTLVFAVDTAEPLTKKLYLLSPRT